ncbi:glycosyltransferase family 4 protein [Leptospira sp. 2 VSF19]|uniref:Glycosyltransferase family 4 protein n=1 Tax=Leptospira soteropolitanensis TaxID=2950025 RepID=A0AAW5VCQ9_9LEPT|nr:glycosyltransferase family 4 protein [Leptospira soteropolitanensis]MCW7491343.1 glycosyltransferase family 4 protein [Leptospira soteropolitanensis]MCW7498928.1 glycosyltransferase family 4 protein [Leptospira soteropolitanensis]MCW7521480.1 glycosyltransferase family 4 protein [Leptospira soteropolitanensis]MCW7525031.1 glycosyltransferase family 4 protein [Leptospira soteropolitanensis]MCW7528899.1 glycosyltransferase family 4 protein [Leptospira soteropolitanensis]
MAKILIVTARFLENASGGAEKLAYDYASILSESNDVTVCTSSAKDYVSWKNELPKGQINENQIRIIRFPVKQTRNMAKMNRLLNQCLEKGDSVSDKEQFEFLKEQGPYCPDLVDYVIKEQNHFDIAVLIGYLYYPVVASIPNLKIPFVIVPTFHDEPPFRLPMYKKTYSNRYIYSFNAPEELAVYEDYTKQNVHSYFLIGTYINDTFKNQNHNNSHSNQLITIGRIEPAKGYPELFEFFKNWNFFAHRSDISMKCLGTISSMEIPKDPLIVFTGYISEEEKISEIQKSFLLLNPSAYESFSISIMESWIQEKAVLINAKSTVMRGHCLRSQGGLFYSDSLSFQRTLDFLLENRNIANRMGKNGRQYVLANFSKEVIRKKLNQMVSMLLG